MQMEGVVVCSFGLNYLVETHDKIYQTISKSKRNDYVVGDYVNIEILNDIQAQIISLLKRKNLISRVDSNRIKIIASNIDNLIIVTAVKPNCNFGLLNSFLVFAESLLINPIIIINKTDLIETKDFEVCVRNLYENKLKYKCIAMQANYNCDALLQFLEGKNNLLVGQSGVGKSSIINMIIPNAAARTGLIKKSENGGCHITTNATLYHYNSKTNLIDCPGIQDFGLMHLSQENLIDNFPELRVYKGMCKYRNCSHLFEDSCIILKAYQNKEIDVLRFELFKKLSLKLNSKSKFKSKFKSNSNSSK